MCAGKAGWDLNPHVLDSRQPSTQNYRHAVTREYHSACFGALANMRKSGPKDYPLGIVNPGLLTTGDVGGRLSSTP